MDREEKIRELIVETACEMRKWFRRYEKIQNAMPAYNDKVKISRLERLQEKRNRASFRFTQARAKLFKLCRMLEKLEE